MLNIIYRLSTFKAMNPGRMQPMQHALIKIGWQCALTVLCLWRRNLLSRLGINVQGFNWHLDGKAIPEHMQNQNQSQHQNQSGNPAKFLCMVLPMSATAKLNTGRCERLTQTRNLGNLSLSLFLQGEGRG